MATTGSRTGAPGGSAPKLGYGKIRKAKKKDTFRVSSPSCNTGAKMTNSLSIDHLAFTGFYADMVELASFFKGIAFETLSHGYHGYKRGMSAFGRSIIICDHPERSEMGTWVQISGEGCRYLECIGIDLPGFIAEQLSKGAKMKRIDTALDTSSVHVDKVHRHAKKLAFRGRINRSKSIRLYENVGEAGKTLYFGSAQSDGMLRVYDKHIESGYARFDPDSTIWTRFEYQFRNEKAQEIAESWALGDVAGVLGLCKAFVEFTSFSSDESNISRRKVASWFNCLFGNVQARKFQAKEFVGSIVKRTKNWIEKQWLQTLAVVIETGDLANLVELAVTKIDQKKQKHIFLKNAILFDGGLRLGQMSC